MKGQILSEKIIKNFEEYLHSEEKSAATIEKYIRDVHEFMAYTTDAAITRERVIEYKVWLLKKNYAVRSISSILASLNRLFSFLKWIDCKVILKSILSLILLEYKRLIIPSCYNKFVPKMW